MSESRPSARRASATSAEKDENCVPTNTAARRPSSKSTWPLTSSPPSGPDASASSTFPNVALACRLKRGQLRCFRRSASIALMRARSASPKTKTSSVFNDDRPRATPASAVHAARAYARASRPCALRTKSSSARQWIATAACSFARPVAAARRRETSCAARRMRRADENAALTLVRRSRLRRVSTTSLVQQSSSPPSDQTPPRRS
mmetsp:Transcript_10323/g.30480  ORF Transcript_10323/g.30480 Transcript_10323/m.30480 type:complete len:205 (+) Transcript_10323:1585-2199(+)